MRNGLTLPEVVLDRLSVEQRQSILTDAPGPGKRGLVAVERRTRPMELRAEAGNDPHLIGYAMTWGVPYEVAGGPDAGGFTEIIERGAADKSLAERSDVRFLADHEGLVLARTASGTLRLSTDDVGLLSDASLDPSSPYAQSVISAVRRGDMSQMSHSMRVMRQTWSDDYTERRIQEVAMYDTSVVGFPANPVTAIALDQRALDPIAEAAEDSLVDQIRVLLAQLIAGEAAEMAAGDPATMSLSELIAIARHLDYWQECDKYEDASGMAEGDDEDELPVGRSMSLATARAMADALALGRK
jgi:HK97 family phage prohead protease